MMKSSTMSVSTIIETYTGFWNSHWILRSAIVRVAMLNSKK